MGMSPGQYQTSAELGRWASLSTQRQSITYLKWQEVYITTNSLLHFSDPDGSSRPSKAACSMAPETQIRTSEMGRLVSKQEMLMISISPPSWSLICEWLVWLRVIRVTKFVPQTYAIHIAFWCCEFGYVPYKIFALSILEPFTHIYIYNHINI